MFVEFVTLSLSKGDVAKLSVSSFDRLMMTFR